MPKKTASKSKEQPKPVEAVAEPPKKRGPQKGVKRGPNPVKKATVTALYQGAEVPLQVYQATINGQEKTYPLTKEGLTEARAWVKEQRKPKAVPKHAKLAKTQYMQIQKLDITKIPAENHEWVGVVCQALELLAKPYFDLKAMYAPKPADAPSAADLLQGLGS